MKSKNIYQNRKPKDKRLGFFKKISHNFLEVLKTRECDKPSHLCETTHYKSFITNLVSILFLCKVQRPFG